MVLPTQTPESAAAGADGLFIDEIVDKALALCQGLPEQPPYLELAHQIADLHSRLTQGKLHLAVLGQFNRGKSTFINALLGQRILPTSVLPITSVPTVITFGFKNRATIRFRDGKKEIISAETLQEIRQLLLSYVAEENNPKNHLGVAEVTIECQSSILHHGTVLIDTPGFGSTHVHNTQTTLDLLSSCDAALFLLSADLPITQVEVDFLRVVTKTVPRIFFVFNKVDLLSPEELDKCIDYVRTTLVRELGFAADVRLFRVCARQAETAEGHHDAQPWQQSGLEVIETEIIGFMLREKYFALSEALDTKFKGTILAIIDRLEADRRELNEPIEALSAAASRFESGRRRFCDHAARQQRLLDEEGKRLGEFLQRRLESRQTALSAALKEKFSTLVAHSTLRPAELALLDASLSQLFQEMFARTHQDLLVSLNKPLLRLSTTLKSALVDEREKVIGACGLDPDRQPAVEPPEMEIDAEEWTAPGLQACAVSALPRFASQEKRCALLLEASLPQIQKQLDQHCRRLGEELASRQTRQIEAFRQALRQAYQVVDERLEGQLRQAREKVDETQRQAEPRLNRLAELSRNFADVRQMLI